MRKKCTHSIALFDLGSCRLSPPSRWWCGPGRTSTTWSASPANSVVTGIQIVYLLYTVYFNILYISIYLLYIWYTFSWRKKTTLYDGIIFFFMGRRTSCKICSVDLRENSAVANTVGSQTDALGIDRDIWYVYNFAQV